jgi:hypothetical protein
MGLYPERGKSHSVGAIRKPRAVLPRLPRSRKNTAVGALLAIQELTRRKSNSVETLINDLAKGAYGSEQKAAKCVQRENTGKTAAWTVLIKKVPKLDQLKDGRNHQSELQRKLKKRLRTENSRPTPPPPPKKRRGTRGRSVLDAHSTTPVPKKSSSKKRGPKPNQVHKGFLTFAGILDIIEYMSGSRDKENYLARQRHLQRKYGKNARTIRNILKKARSNVGKAIGDVFTKGGRREKVSERLITKTQEFIDKWEEEGETPSPKKVKAFAAKAHLEYECKRNVHASHNSKHIGRDCLREIMNAVTVTHNDDAVAQVETVRRKHANKSVRSAVAHHCTAYENHVSPDSTQYIDPRGIINADPTTFYISNDLLKIKARRGGGRRKRHVSKRGKNNVKTTSGGKKGMLQNIKLLSAMSGGGDLSEVVLLKKKSGFTHKGKKFVKLKFPGLTHTQTSRGKLANGHVWIFGDVSDEEINDHFHKDIMLPFVDNIRKNVMGYDSEKDDLSDWKYRVCTWYDGEWGQMQPFTTRETHNEYFRQNMTAAKSSAARTAKEQPADVSKCFLVLKTLWGNVRVDWSPEDPVEEQLAVLAEDMLKDIKGGISQVYKAALKFLIPRLPSIWSARSRHTTSKWGFARQAT